MQKKIEKIKSTVFHFWDLLKNMQMKERFENYLNCVIWGQIIAV